MEMTRRGFVAALGAAVAGTLAGATWLAVRLSPRRMVTAVRGRTFPGKLRPLRDEDIRTPGRWAG